MPSPGSIVHPEELSDFLHRLFSSAQKRFRYPGLLSSAVTH